MNPIQPLTIAATATTIIRERRSIFPPAYLPEIIKEELILELLENANYAPTHRLTEPWRFKVIAGEKRGALGDLLAELYKKNSSEEKFVERKYQKIKEKTRQSSHIFAICMQRDAEARVPEWEEIAATAMAVQNIWLSASAHKIGAYWSSPSLIKEEECRQFLNLKEGERCLGFLYLGYHEAPKVSPKRTPIAEKVEWL
ncbi:MAG: nitroreductase family protein [Aureispira sp.]